MVVDTPLISTHFVRLALDSLIQTTREREPNPLHYLVLVDEIVTRPEFPHLEHSREYALETLLLEMVSEVYTRQCLLQGLPTPTAKELLSDALESITRNALTNRPGIISWGSLYHRYVRSDIEITTEQFCEVSHIDPRTLRRYQNRAFRQLTDMLTQREHVARSRLRRERLMNAMPARHYGHLYGRQHILNNLREEIYHQPALHLLITGVAGIGKTVVTQELLHSLIEDDAIEHLIWLHKPPTVQFVINYLNQTLLPDPNEFSLKDCISHARIAIVLDGIEHLLENETASLEMLLDMLDQALVCVTSEVHFTVNARLKHVKLDELSKADAEHLIWETLRTYHLAEAVPSEVPSIVQQAGGNPRVIRLIAQNLDVSISVYHKLIEIFNKTRSTLTENELTVWLIFALLPPETSLTLSDMTTLLPDSVHNEALMKLSRRYLVNTGTPSTNQRFYLDTSIRRYLETIIREDSGIKQIAYRLIYELTKPTSGQARLLFLNVIEHILRADWIHVPHDLATTWVKTIWQDALHYGHATVWQQIMERLCAQPTSASPEILRIYGVILRHLGEIDSALDVFSLVIEITGQNGDFIQQAWSILETAVILRQQGNYSSAISYIARAEHIGKKWNAPNLIDAAHLERVQVWIDTGRVADAQEILRDIPQTVRTFFLEVEAHLLLQSPDAALRLLQDEFDLLCRDMRDRARGHVLMGRCYTALRKFESARHHLDMALTCLGKVDDYFALARIEINLAALLTELGEYEDAYRLLRRAKGSQLNLHDRVALAAIRHNLFILDVSAAN
ncbi:MAG: hypothetical protein K8I60_17355 [Anaerolineae bacterium]|nr:hypothetical protein [Anaerolineae bacterium]